MNEIIKVQNLSKTYISQGAITQAVNDITTSIKECDFTVIMGSSGSGKSSLIYLLSGLDKPTSGTVIFENADFSKMNESKKAIFRRKNIGFIFQSMNLIPNLTLFENIVVPGYLIEKRSVVDKRAKELMEKLEIWSERNKIPAQVSGGQQQRAAIVRSLINSPKVLFGDEPTGALNSTQGQNVLDILTDANRAGQSIVMVTHDAKAAIRANRLIYIKDGQIESELKLEPYTIEKSHEREKEVFEFLTSKGW